MIEVNYNDYKRILEENMRLIPENYKLEEEVERLENIIKEVREILNTQLAFTSSYQLNYQSAMSIIEEAKSILQGVDKN